MFMARDGIYSLLAHLPYGASFKVRNISDYLFVLIVTSFLSYLVAQGCVKSSRI